MKCSLKESLELLDHDCNGDGLLLNSKGVICSKAVQGSIPDGPQFAIQSSELVLVDAVKPLLEMAQNMFNLILDVLIKCL